MSNLYIVTTAVNNMDRNMYSTTQTIMADVVINDSSEYVFSKDSQEIAWFPKQTVISIVNKGCLANER